MKTKYRVTLVLITLCIAAKAQPGLLDETFNPQTQAGAFVKACALQSDGKLIIAGEFPGGIMRLNDDGSLDDSFVTGTGANNTVAAVAIQDDGKVLIGGSFTSYNGVTANRLTRLNVDGTPDNTFNTGTGLDTGWFSFYPFGAYVIALQDDGRIVIGGNFDFYNGQPAQNLLRLHPDGTPDSTFTSLPGPDFPVFSIVIQSDGRLVIGGRFTYTPDGFVHGFVARLSAEGLLDTAFSENVSLGPTNVTEVRTTAVQSDGKIVIGGNFNHCNGVTPIRRLCRLNSDGTRDETFQVNQVEPAINYMVNTSVVLEDGRILVGGSGTYSDTLNRVVRLNGDGTLDPSFTRGVVANGDVYAAAVQTDGKMIICGDFTAYDGKPRNGVARLHGDGTTHVNPLHGAARGSRVIPNPGSGVFSVCVDEQMAGATINIFDPLGKKVYEATVEALNPAHVIDIAHKGKGTYYMTIQSGAMYERHKVIVW